MFESRLSLDGARWRIVTEWMSSGAHVSPKWGSNAWKIWNPIIFVPHTPISIRFSKKSISANIWYMIYDFMHMGFLWVLCIFFDIGIATYRTRTLKGSVRFRCGHRTAHTIRVHMDFIRAWEHSYDYVCRHHEVPCGCHIRAWEYPYNQSCRAVLRPMSPVSAPAYYIY